MIVYIATTHIQHGVIVDGNNKNLIFDKGDVVIGVDSKSMRALWDIGAIVREDRPDTPKEVKSES